MTRVWAVYFSYFATSLIIALLVTPVIRQLAFRVGAVDHGTGRRIHSGVIPRLGGIAIFIAFMAPLLFSLTRGAFDEFHRKLAGILIAATLVFITGIFDDFKRASIWQRLLVEAGAAGAIYFWGIRITAISNPFGGMIELGWLGLPLTVAWVVVITNAINLIDGLDGLATGTGIMIAVTMLILGFSKDTHINLVFFMLIGALAGFLVYNFPPASIFMGDSGSLFLGFFLAAFTISSSFKAQAMATMMIPLAAFSIPLMDMSYAVLRRYYRGIPLGKPDREHIHHKLMELGFGKTKTVLLLYLLNGGVLAFILIFVSANVKMNYLLLFALFLLAVAGLRLLGYLQFRVFFQTNLRNFRISRKRRYLNYLIRRFRNECDRCRDQDSLKCTLQSLFFDYGLGKVELIVPGAGDAQVLYRSETNDPEREFVQLSFPISTLKPPGVVMKLTKQVDDDGFLCTAELIHALNGALGRSFQNCNPAHPRG